MEDAIQKFVVLQHCSCRLDMVMILISGHSPGQAGSNRPFPLAECQRMSPGLFIVLGMVINWLDDDVLCMERLMLDS